MSARVRAIALAVVGVAALAAALFVVNRPAPALAKAGDCVTAPSDGSFHTDGCSDAAAKFVVKTIILGSDDPNLCDATPGTAQTVRETVGATERVLCLTANSSAR